MLKQKENPVTSQFVPLLRKMSPGWRMEEQQTIFEDSSRTPDVIVTRDGHEAGAIEAKWTDSPKDGVAQVRSRYLGRRLCPDFVGVSETLRAAMVVRYPTNLRDKSGADIRTLLKNSEDIEYLPARRFGGADQTVLAGDRCSCAASSCRQPKGLDIPREICDTMMTSPGGTSARTVNRKELQSA